MNVLHVTAFHSSLSIGGTERYIDALQNAFAAVYGAKNFVEVFPFPQHLTINNVSYLCASMANDRIRPELRKECRKLLDQVKPDFAIFHTCFTSEYLMAEELLSRKIPYAFILHAPYWACHQKDRFFSCKTPCHRIFSPLRCAICSWWKPANLVVQLIKFVRREFLGILGHDAPQLYRNLKQELSRKEFIIKNASACIVLNQRDYDAMLENGIAPEQLHIIQSGLSEEVLSICHKNAKKVRLGKLKMLCAGRYDSVKGFNMIVDAANTLPKEMDFQLDIYGFRDRDNYYVSKGFDLAANNSHIHIHPMLPPMELLPKLADYDVLCIPSCVFDNGPLVVLEGLYSGCLVATSEFIGLKNDVEKYGIIIHPNSVAAWRDFLKQCIDSKEAIRAKPRKEFPKYRSMNSIAKEIAGLLRPDLQSF